MTQNSSLYLSHLIEQNLSEKIALQIKKEFEKINESIDLDLSDYEKTIKIITEKIKVLERRTPNKLVEILYHSDIAEEKVINTLHKNEDYHQALAEQLILRSAQKVYFKIKYTKKRAEKDNI